MINKMLMVGAALFACADCMAASENVKSSPFAREYIEWQDLWVENADVQKADLPRVLMFGDSISRQYRDKVSKRLKGKAFIVNSASSRCVGDPAFMAETRHVLSLYDYDVIHFNNGLHGFSSNDGDFGPNLEKWIALIRQMQPKAKLIWATITYPKNATEGRVAKRNAAADKVIAALGNIAVDDLGAISRAHPDQEEAIHFVGLRPVWARNCAAK